MSIVVNLFGGPGVGKSTFAAGLYYFFKVHGHSCELVREYVKEFLYEDKKVGDFDQLFFLGEGIRRESILYGKVDVIVTDSPVQLCSFYARKYCKPYVASSVDSVISAFYRQASELGHKHLNVFLTRTHEYVQSGRFETHEQALEIDDEIRVRVRKDMEINSSTFGIDEVYKHVNEMLKWM